MKLTIDQALQQGVEAHKAGQLQDADRIYTAILKAQPKHPDANHNMGVLAVGVGKVEAALPFFKTALEANPSIAQFWLSYIDALIKLDRLTEAKNVLDQAKSKGAKGDGFDKLVQRLNDTGEETIATSKIAAEAPPPQPNILDSLKLNQAISLAKNKAKEGDPEEAKRIYQDILIKFPKNKRASEGLKRLLGSSVGYASKVQDPPQDRLQTLINLYGQGQLQQALNQVEAIIQQYPGSAILFKIQGTILRGLGQLDASIESYNKSLAINHDDPEAYNNMGNALKEQGKLDAAILAYNNAITIKPDYAEAYYNMGVTLQEQGDLVETIRAYNQALKIKPDYAVAYNNMGNALKEQGKLDAAILAYNNAISIKPDYTEAFNNKGVALQDQGKFEDAIEAYKNALAIKPDNSEAWSNGAEALETWNKLEELSLWLEKAFQIFEPAPADISLMKAKLLWRNKDTQAAIKLMSNIDIETITPFRKQTYFHIKAKCYDALKHYDLAYDCFRQMNSFAIKSNDYFRLDPESYFEKIRDQLAILKSGAMENPVKLITEKKDFVPVFLVGFPRSGTTLLDTILRSHSNIDVVEEQPLVNAAEAFAANNGYTEIGQALPQEIISGARKAYTTELDKHIGSTGKKSVLVDKLPLNLLQIPLIQQLYPKAKFILALRHPLDTILSCWMQDFKLNSAMANMVDLDRIVEFYCVAMEIFKICRSGYNLNVHQIKYEDLIEDLRGEASALLKFLDLDWEPQMENYQETALKRGRINTPSYSQVINPIYKEAKYRWLNYEKHLRQYISQVEPWINEFGYSKP